MESNLIIELWDTFESYIPEKNKDVAAAQYVDFLLNDGIDISDFEEFLGYDPHLDAAIQTVMTEEGMDDDDNDVGYSEEEDY